jgi:hypothetical protein
MKKILIFLIVLLALTSCRISYEDAWQKALKEKNPNICLLLAENNEDAMLQTMNCLTIVFSKIDLSEQKCKSYSNGLVSYYCFKIVARKEGDYSICNNIETKKGYYYRNDCIYNVALQTLEPAACDRMKAENQEEQRQIDNCKKLFQENYSGPPKENHTNEVNSDSNGKSKLSQELIENGFQEPPTPNRQITYTIGTIRVRSRSTTEFAIAYYHLAEKGAEKLYPGLKNCASRSESEDMFDKEKLSKLRFETDHKEISSEEIGVFPITLKDNPDDPFGAGEYICNFCFFDDLDEDKLWSEDVDLLFYCEQKVIEISPATNQD